MAEIAKNQVVDPAEETVAQSIGRLILLVPGLALIVGLGICSADPGANVVGWVLGFILLFLALIGPEDGPGEDSCDPTAL